MAASTRSGLSFTNASDAEFRSWVAAVIAAILAGGFTQTLDAGQINTATVTAPAVVNTAQGYAMFESGDAGGGLNAFKMKVEFGSGATSATRPAIWITCSFGATDGAGAFTGVASTRTQFGTNSNPSGTPDINFSAGGGRFVMAMNTTTADLIFVASVERTRNSDLTERNELLIIGSNAAAATWACQCVNELNAYPQVTSGFSIAPAVGNTPVGGIVGLGLAFGFAPGVTSPSTNLIGAENASLGLAQETLLINVLGANVPYKIQAYTAASTQNAWTRFAGYLTLARYD